MNHASIQLFARSKQFCHIVNYAIIAFACLIGIETVLKEPEWQHLFRIIDYIFLSFFSIEIILRILAEDHPGLFFVLFHLKKVNRDGKTRTVVEFTEHGFWNYFDFILILLSTIGIFAQLFLHPSFFQVGRLFRIFRIFRLLEISEHLKEVERRIMSIVPTVFSFAVLLLILNYIYAIMGMFMFESRVFETCNFSTMVDSFVTLFQVMTLDNWSDVMDDIKTHTPAYNPFIIQLYFVSFVIFTSIIAFNVFIAVMTSQVQNKMEHDIQEKVDSAVADTDSYVQLKQGMNEIMAELRNVKTELTELKRKSPTP
ncbi:MAG TPA: ion transporter [Cyclobacteriaceae bacterium]|nr:ion transporter [Cyclobacteriaceae bacterium]